MRHFSSLFHFGFALFFLVFITKLSAAEVDALIPTMIDIPAGSYQMGCVSEIDCKPRETPVHHVEIAAFKLGKTEVTAALWAKCVELKGCDYMPANDGLTDPNMPVRYVSWDDIQVFLTWLNKTTGKQYRLPSESEWEYAARAGTETPFSTGNCIDISQANFEGNAFKIAGCNQEGENIKQAVPVASYPANAFGLHDMHGNMWEWVADCWHRDYEGAPSDGSPWFGKESECERHVMRGGAWHGSVSYMRSAYRFRFPKEARSGGLGFRLALDVD